MGKEKTQIQTGDIIPINEKNLKVLSTFDKETKALVIMLDVLTERQRSNHERLWDTVYGLYPELKEFNLHISWKKKEITVRYKNQEEG